MARLEELKQGVLVKGVLPDCVVTVTETRWLSSDSVDLTYTDPSGTCGNRFLDRSNEAPLEIVPEPDSPPDDLQAVIKRRWEDAKGDYEQIGGWASFKSGDWLWRLIHKSFANYWARANVEYFQKKYRTLDKDKIAEKLIAVTARNAAVLGAIVGAAVSADEITAIITVGEGGVGLPANLAIAAAALGSEAILLVHFQLQLVANLGKMYGVPLDPDDPEDILTILAFAAGGSVADAAGKFGMKIGGKLAGRVAKAVFRKEVLAFFKRIAAKVGIKILQRTIVKYTVPIASIAIGTAWNYLSVKTVAKIAVKHFKQRAADVGIQEADLSGADLSGTDLREADLRGMDLKGTDFSGADLTRADLSGANVRGAKFCGARLHDANLAGVLELTQRQIDMAHGNQQTVLPDGIQRPVHW